MDNQVIVTAAEYIGVLGCAFWGGMKGGKKAMKTLNEEVDWLKRHVILILGTLGIPQDSGPGNGKSMDLGRSTDFYRPEKPKGSRIEVKE